MALTPAEYQALLGDLNKPKPAEPLGVLGSVGEVGRQAGAGLAVDLPRTVGAAGRALFDDDTAEGRYFKDMQQGADSRAPGWAPNPAAGKLTQFLGEGARGVSMGAPLIAAGMVPGAGPALAVGGGAALFGLAGGQDKADELRAAGASESDVRTGAALAGGVGAAAGGLAQFVGGRYLWPAAKGLAGAEAKTVPAALAAMTKAPSLAANYAKGVAADAAVMGAQSGADQAISNAYGGQEGSVLDAAKHGAVSGAALGMVGGTLGIRHTLVEKRLAQRTSAEVALLTDPTTTQELFDSKLSKLGEMLQQRGIDTAQIQAWQGDVAKTRAMVLAEAQKGVDLLNQKNKAPADPLAVQTRINTMLGIGATNAKHTAEDFEAAVNELTGHRISGEHGIERPETTYESILRHAGLLQELTQAKDQAPAEAPAPLAQQGNQPTALAAGIRQALDGGQETAALPGVQAAPGALAGADVTARLGAQLPDIHPAMIWPASARTNATTWTMHQGRVADLRALEEARSSEAAKLAKDRATAAGILTEAGQKHFASLEALRDNGGLTPQEFAEAVSFMRDKKAAAYGEIKRQIAEATEKLKDKQNASAASVPPVLAGEVPEGLPADAGRSVSTGVHPDGGGEVAGRPGAGAAVVDQSGGLGAPAGQTSAVGRGASEQPAAVKPTIIGSLDEAHAAINAYTQKKGAEKMRHAMRLVLGLDEEGHQTGSAMSLPKAAAAAGYKDHGALSVALQRVGLDEATRDRVMSAGGMAYEGEQVATKGASGYHVAATDLDPKSTVRRGVWQSANERTVQELARNNFRQGKFKDMSLDEFQEMVLEVIAKNAAKPTLEATEVLKKAEEYASRAEKGEVSFRKVDEADTFKKEEAQAEINAEIAETGEEPEAGYTITRDEDGSPIYSSNSEGVWSQEEASKLRMDVVKSLHTGNPQVLGGVLTHSALAGHPVVHTMFKQLHAMGLGGLRQQVKALTVVDLKGKADAVAYKLQDGTTVIAVDKAGAQRGRLPQHAQEMLDNLHHELGHAVQDAVDVTGRHAEWQEGGAAVRELVGLYQTNDIFTHELHYPFGDEEMPLDVMREEALAQAWKLYSGTYKDILRKFAPETYASLEKIHGEVQQRFSGDAGRRDEAQPRPAEADGRPVGEAGGQPRDGGRPTDSGAESGRAGADAQQPAGSADPVGAGPAGVPEGQGTAGEADQGNLRDGGIRAVRSTVDRTREQAGLGDSALEQIKQDAAAKTPQAVKDAGTNLGAFFEKHLPNLMTVNQMVQRFEGRLPAIRTFSDLLDKMSAATSALTKQATDILMDASHIHGQQRDALNKLMLESTRARIHADKAFGKDGNEHLTETDKATHAKLARDFAALTPKAKKAYQQMRDLGAQTIEASTEARKADLQHAFSKALLGAYAGKPETVDTLMKQAETRIKSLDDNKFAGPYFPLLREGQYLSVGDSKELAALREQHKADPSDALRDKIAELEGQDAHHVVQAHDTAAGQKAAVEAYTRAGMTAGTRLAQEYVPALRGKHGKTLADVAHMADANLSAEDAAHFKSLLEAYAANSGAANNSLARRLARTGRHGVAGANTDMIRSFAVMFEKEARFQANAAYGSDLDAALAQIGKDAKGNNQLERIHHTLAENLRLTRNPVKSPLANALTGLVYTWEIGVQPARMLTYMMQPHMLSLPVLAGEYGFGKSAGVMNRATADAFRLFKTAKSGDGEWHGARGLDLDKAAKAGILTKGELALLKHMQDTDQLEMGMHSDLRGLTHTHNGRLGQGMDMIHKAEGWAMGHIDTATRAMSALAAYRLHLEKHGSHADAMRFAQDHTKYTQFEYGASASPVYFRGGALARIAFQFRRYQQGCLNLLYTQAEQAFKGDTRAMKSIGIMLATHALLAGAIGMPLAGTAMGVVNAFLRDDDPEGDARSRLRRAVYDVAGKDLGHVLMDGITAPLGVSLTRHVGMGTVLTDEHLMPPGLGRVYNAKNRDKVPALAFGAMGPVGGWLERIFEGRQFMQQGDYVRGVESMLPESLADAVTAGLFATRGMQDMKGHVNIKPDDISAGTIATKALGFAPEQEHLFEEESGAKGRVEAAMRLKRQNLSTQFANAVVNGGDLDSIKAAVQKYNELHQGTGSAGKLTYSELYKAAAHFRKEQMQAQRRESGVGYDPVRNRQLRDLTTMED